MTARALIPSRAHALHDRAATRRIEAAAQVGLTPHTLMARAGLAVAGLARALAPHAGRAWIAAGPGNNGGDGLEAAAHLQRAGWQVTVTWLGDGAHAPGDTLVAWQRARDAGVRIVTDLPETPVGAQDVVIDALLGIGASRAPDARMQACIETLNRHPGTVLAIDVPSGLDADTGRPFGTACVRATQTLSLLTLKPGLFTGDGRDHAGQVWFDGLGTAALDDVAPTAHLACSPAPAPRRHAQHKGSFGDVLVVGGGPGMTGAALLAARAAHAAGAGRVHVDLLDPHALALDAARPELMFKRGAHLGPLARKATVVAGCGAGSGIGPALARLLDAASRLVIDADGLNAVAADAALQARLEARDDHGHATVLTPHPLEAARLLGTDTATVQADRLASARRLAERFRCTVVLKGSGSVIATAGTAPVINPTGNASLASAGTGDVLAGWIGGQWSALGPGESPAMTAQRVAIDATWQHGEAADRSPWQAMRAADLVDTLHTLQRR